MMSNTEQGNFYVDVCYKQGDKPGQTHFDITPNGDWDLTDRDIARAFLAYVRELLWLIAANNVVLIGFPYTTNSRMVEKWEKTRKRRYGKKVAIEDVFYPDPDIEMILEACKPFPRVWCNTLIQEERKNRTTTIPYKVSLIVAEQLPKDLWDELFVMMGNVPISLLFGKIKVLMKIPVIGKLSAEAMVELYSHNACNILEASQFQLCAHMGIDLWEGLYAKETFFERIDETARAAGLVQDYHEYDPRTQRYVHIKRIEPEEKTR